jgi:hypothetical protein
MKLSETPPKWDRCPGCRSKKCAEFSTPEFDNDDILQEGECTKCGTRWHDWYRADERVVFPSRKK